MVDEVLAGLAPLVGMMLAGEDERCEDTIAVDHRSGLVGVLLHDREEISEQLALERRELGILHGLSRSGQRRVDPYRLGALRARVVPRAGQAASRALVSIVRYRNPSSRRAW